MLREDTVQEVLARLARGEGIKALARELGVDPGGHPNSPTCGHPKLPHLS